jgi:hypothetical protein
MAHDEARAVDQATVHERAFWVSLRADGFKVPEGESPSKLAVEAAALLGSTDPELRDAIAYEAIETWVYREQRLDAAELERLRLTLSANARRGLGAAVGDELFWRSFSTLALAVLAAEDLKRPFLDAQRFDELVQLGIDALNNDCQPQRCGPRTLRGLVQATVRRAHGAVVRAVRPGALRASQGPTECPECIRRRSRERVGSERKDQPVGTRLARRGPVAGIWGAASARAPLPRAAGSPPTRTR